MADQTPPQSAPQPPKSNKPGVSLSKMDKLVALCRRRGFVWQSSEIYGGINGFWDYGPLGVELKKNLKDAWWHDIVRCPAIGADGQLMEMVGLDCTIIMNPKVWVASGHASSFADAMVDCRETKRRYRPDQLRVEMWSISDAPNTTFGIAVETTSDAEFEAYAGKHMTQFARQVLRNAGVQTPAHNVNFTGVAPLTTYDRLTPELKAFVYAPGASTPNTLTDAKAFNLMFETFVGAVQSDESKAYLRPETAQGIFANWRNVTDTQRVKVPFGIAQIGKAFRNEVTPRNFTFRSREFEQMEIEFFIHPSTANEWYKFWRDSRFKWWQSIGLTSSHLQLREHEKDELAHYAKDGAGTSDIEYKFPFTDPGFGELEGVAHRADYDLRQHAQHSGLGDKLKYFDQDLQVKLLAEKAAKEQIDAQCRYFPHVIEPSAGADRGALALLCEAYTEDPVRGEKGSPEVMKFHPRMAPIKAAILPLVAKEGMPEIAEKLYMDLRKTWNVQLDIKQNIGKRYARMDEAGTPFCFTIDGDTLKDQTVTVRDRDTTTQERINISKVREYLQEKIGG